MTNEELTPVVEAAIRAVLPKNFLVVTLLVGPDGHLSSVRNCSHTTAQDIAATFAVGQPQRTERSHAS